MDITALSTSLSQANLGSWVRNAMLSKTMDNTEVMGENLVKMIETASLENSVNPMVGSNIDIKI